MPLEEPTSIRLWPSCRMSGEGTKCREPSSWSRRRKRRANYPLLIFSHTREIQPLIFTRFRSMRGTLTSGDYRIQNVDDFRVERKGSVDEMAGCCVGNNRERLERVFTRLRPCRSSAC